MSSDERWQLAMRQRFGGCLLILARPPAVKVLGVVYPGVMLVAVVVTGNHYIADAIVSALIVIVATALAHVADTLWAAARGSRQPIRRVSVGSTT